MEGTTRKTTKWSKWLILGIALAIGGSAIARYVDQRKRQETLRQQQVQIDELKSQIDRLQMQQNKLKQPTND